MGCLAGFKRCINAMFARKSFKLMPGRHEAYFRSKDKQDIHLPAKNSDVTLEKDELLNIEWSYKVRSNSRTGAFGRVRLTAVLLPRGIGTVRRSGSPSNQLMESPKLGISTMVTRALRCSLHEDNERVGAL